MFANERQNKICDIIKEKGAVTVSELIEMFNVSNETVRKDLMILENENLLKRVHGGAVLQKEMKSFANLSLRNDENSEFKQELSQTAVNFVENGDTIAIDSGSTAIHFAKALKNKFKNLTVVTASLDVFNILCRENGFRIILCGGEFMESENAFIGPLTCDILEKLHVSKSFIFVSGISLSDGICDFCPEILEVQRKLIKCGNKVYVSADSSKFEKPALFKLEDMKSNYTYITDSNLSKELKELYKENGFEVITK